MEIYDIGTKVSESAIALHLYNFEVKPQTPAYLHDKLGLRVDEQWSALQWPANERVLLRVYEAKRSAWNGKILRLLSDGSVTQLEMQPGSEISEAEQIDLLIEGETVYNDPFASWLLPEEDFTVPLSGSMLGQMCGLVGGEAASCTTISDRKFVYPAAEIAELQERVQRLLEHIAVREAKWAKVAKSLAAHRKAQNLLRLQSRGFHVAPDGRGLPSAEALDKLRAAMAEAHDDVVAELMAAEGGAADAVLEMFASEEIIQATETLAFDPLAVDVDEADELIVAVRFACEALARSSAAEKLLRDHVWPAIGEACRNPPYAFDTIIADLTNRDFREQLDIGWLRTHAEVQETLGAPSGPSILKKLAQAAKYYRTGPSIISAALYEGVLMSLWDSLDGSAKWRGRKLSALLLRFVISSGIPDPSNQSLMVGGRLDFKKVLQQIDKFPKSGSPQAFLDRAEQLKKLKLRAQFMRVPSMAGLALVTSVAILWSAAVDDELEGMTRAMVLASAIANVTDAAVNIVIMVKAYQGELSALSLTADSMTAFGRLSVLFGTFASGIRMYQKGKFADVLGFTSGVLRMSGWLSLAMASMFETNTAAGIGRHLGARILGAWLALVGSVLGHVALIWALLPAFEVPTQGPQLLFEHYFEMMLHPSGAFSSRETALRLAYGASQKRALGGYFSPHNLGRRDLIGEPGVWGDDDPPTWHAAYMLGLNAEEIAVLFCADVEEVVSKGIPRSHRGDVRPGQNLTGEPT
jgi:archaellum component FlaF (FlaF/FlaG flagellin family)